MEKDSQQKDESPRSFVSQMLPVSPVFDEEDDSGAVDSKMQTWSSQLYRNEPETLVAKEAGITTKHPLWPVPSIKQSIQEITGRFNQFNYECKTQISEPRTDSVLLPSPIPSSSRSESTANKVGRKSTLTLPPHRPSSTSPSPKRFSPSPSLSSDAAKPKRIDNNNNNKASPPPATPQPPPSPSERKDTAKRSENELDLRRKGLGSVNDTVTDLPSLTPSNSTEGPSTGRSVRTFRPKQSQSTDMEAAARASDEQRGDGDEEAAEASR